MLLANGIGLFAQAGGNQFGNGNGGAAGGGGGGGPDPAAMAILIVVVFGIIAVVYTILGLFCWTLAKTLALCHEANRTMTPGQVYLNLIPCFNIYWRFVTVNRLSESLDNEYYDRGWRGEGDFGKSLGNWAGGLNLCGNIPYVGAIFSIVSFICFIIYWVKIAGFRKELADDNGERRARRRRTRERDDYDDRGGSDEDENIPKARRADDEPRDEPHKPPEWRDAGDPPHPKRDDDEYRPRDYR